MTARHMHLIGIGGTGLSAIARILHARGWRVSGCDRAANPRLRALQAAGLDARVGHDPAHLAGVDLVLRSSAVPPTHPEVQAAHARGIPVLTRRVFLPTLTAGYRTLAVAGTHGKTTTTAMLAWVLHALGQDPTFVLGGDVPPWGNARAGAGPWFVIEADEYDHMFLGLQPEVAAVTILEHDHPDLFPTWDDYVDAFAAFARRVQRVLVLRADDPGVAALRGRLSAAPAVRTFALRGPADYRAVDVRSQPGRGIRFTLQPAGGPAVPVRLQVPGEHNVANALAALAVVAQLGLDLAAAAEALADFPGAGRRFTVVADRDGIAWVDDYAHHPTEIAATLQAARQRYPDRTLWAVWQPHTFSRTRALWDGFVSALQAADGVLVLAIYAAREAPLPGVTGEALQAAIAARAAAGAGPRVVGYAPTLDEAAAWLAARVQAPAVVLILSAGDAPQVLTRLGVRPRDAEVHA